MRKLDKAFTLVELLTVIAIVCILAGLLFPTFAHAKMAAMRAGSQSNLHQISMASMMYAGDNDDGLPLFATGNALEAGWPGSDVATWVWTTYPYIKNLQVFVDPGMGDPGGYFGSGPNATFWNRAVYPDFGVNYVFLSPWKKDGEGACTQSGSVTISGASHPSETIFYTGTYQPNEDANNSPIGGYTETGNWIVTAPGIYSLVSASPTDCVWPGMDWALHPGSFNGGNPFTAEASQRYDNGGNNAMLDGHVRYLTNERQAAGTDWAVSEYLHTRVVEADKYLWSYDDSLFGTNASR